MQSENPTAWSAAIERNSRLVIGLAILVTGLLAIPFLAMTPDETASQEPGGVVFETRDAIEDRFVSSVYPIFAISEARSGDILTKESLLEMLSQANALRTDSELGATMVGYFDAETGRDVLGVTTLADLVDSELATAGGLAAAGQTDIDDAVANLIDRYGVDSGVLSLSVQTRFDVGTNRWVSSAVTTTIIADNDVLGFGNVSTTLGTDTEPEEYARDVIDMLRGDETFVQTWGVAIDVNLTSAEQGAIAGPFIGFTILAVLIIVGLAFRSYWVMAVTGAALGALIIWLRGISNLIGLKDDLILSLIVPIAMISFGVDFVFHAIGRYREEQERGLEPARAFVIGIGAVSGALVLALASDAAAFLSNVSSGIESIVQFGIGAAIALGAAFLLLGVVTPLAVAEIEHKIGTPPPTRRRKIWRILGFNMAGMLAMTTVLLMVFILPWAGVVALVLYIVGLVYVPYRMSSSHDWTQTEGSSVGGGRLASIVGDGIARVAAARRFVVPAAAALTVAAAFLAVQVPTEFDVKDFFTADSDFVVSLDKLDEHVGDRGGEPGLVYVAAPLDSPEVVAKLADFVDEVRDLDTPTLARDDDGVRVDGGVFEVLTEVQASPIAQGAIQQATGVAITDTNSDGIPDTREQLAAIYGVTRQAGVPFNETRLVLTPNDVRTALWVSEDGSAHATVLELGLTDTRAQESIAETRNVVEPLLAQLRKDLQAIDPAAEVELTGSPVVRQEGLDGITRALQLSLPIAVVLCLAIAWIFMRSARLAVVSITPILMTVAWLYALMEIMGFSINTVTATIAAVSIGIGIDFAIHFAMRYREELASGRSPIEAVRTTGEGTGTALIASAVSSAVGFGILAFAPMPMFASYGFLTAVMILMALAATLLVMPGLLVLATPKAD